MAQASDDITFADSRVQVPEWKCYTDSYTDISEPLITLSERSRQLAPYHLLSKVLKPQEHHVLALSNLDRLADRSCVTIW